MKLKCRMQAASFIIGNGRNAYFFGARACNIQTLLRSWPDRVLVNVQDFSLWIQQPSTCRLRVMTEMTHCELRANTQLNNTCVHDYIVYTSLNPQLCCLQWSALRHDSFCIQSYVATVVPKISCQTTS